MKRWWERAWPYKALTAIGFAIASAGSGAWAFDLIDGSTFIGLFGVGIATIAFAGNEWRAMLTSSVELRRLELTGREREISSIQSESLALEIRRQHQRTRLAIRSVGVLVALLLISRLRSRGRR